MRAGEAAAVCALLLAGATADVPASPQRLIPSRLHPVAPGVSPSFRYDVLPILSRAGCNQGVCHGNSEGRGGLKLSLKAEDPDADYNAIARQGGGRRVSVGEPGASLLLLKPTATMPHGGGMRFPAGSAEYRAIAEWIARGARPDPAGAPRLVALEIAPTHRVLVAPLRSQRLTVLGRFSDGRKRPLNDRAVFTCGDPRVSIDPRGLVTASGAADAAVMVRCADQLATVRLTFVPERKAFAWNPVPESNYIDRRNYAWLRTLRLAPAPLSSDSEFLRRAYLDALGVLPSADEARSFLADTRPDKRSRLIDALLERPEFNDYWTLKWSDLLRLEERSLDPKGAAAYRDWIRAAIAERKPLDQFARDLLTASGSTYANPPANYYRRTRTAPELGENTAQVFMGVRMLCAKCHNHPFERWKQDDYYALAAFFARVDRKGEFTRKDRFDKHELIGEETISPAKTGDVENPRTGRQVSPRLPLRTVAPELADRLSPEIVDAADRRVPFATWLTSPTNPYFARAMVNRIWFHLLGKGIVDPVDDMRESNPPSNPALLDALARDFVDHGYDLRHVVRTIMNSRTYQLSSAPNATNADDESFFSRAIAQRIPAEVLLDAISQVTGVPESFNGLAAGTRATQAVTVRKQNPFLKLFGQPARESVCECERSNETTLGQSFALISGGAVDVKLRQPDNRIGALLKEGKSDEGIVTEFYLACVSRPPTAAEMSAARAYITAKPDRRAALEDLLWALINSKEFLLRR